ncbi:MAG TPA: hypothetical protein VD738_01200 [Nitrospira sp.]|nr:hypothetical protein [Nitrospira sp.]
MMRTVILLCGVIACQLAPGLSESAIAEEDTLAFAVVSEIPKDLARVSARVAIEGTVTDTKLLAPEQILSNLIWKKLEICHALKLEGQQAPEGFRVTSVRAIEGAMLPMALQGFAGDCLLRKALEIAPFVD